MTRNCCVDDKIFFFSEIKAVYEINKQNFISNSLLKLTEAHLNLTPFQKMRVKLVTQPLSFTVASTIKTCLERRELKSYTTLDTPKFFEYIDQIFDCLNNSQNHFTKNSYNCASTN